MLDNEYLTQDTDIMPDVWPASDDWAITDILPEINLEPEVAAVTEEPQVDAWVEPTADAELEALLSWITTTAEDISTSVDLAWDTIEEAKTKVEEIQSDPTNSDDVLKELYQDLLRTETALQATEIAKDVAIAKVSELQMQVSELEINAAGEYQTDNPDLMIVNKLLNAAEGWNDIATPKVKSALNKIYLSLFNTTIEEGQIQDNVDWLDQWGVTLNEATVPVGNIVKEEEPIDINDITSILG